MSLSLSDIRYRASQAGSFFFDRDTMKFFGTRGGDTRLLKPKGSGRYFVVVTNRNGTRPRFVPYEFFEEDARLKHVGEIGGYGSLDSVKDFLKEFVVQ